MAVYKFIYSHICAKSDWLLIYVVKQVSADRAERSGPWKRRVKTATGRVVKTEYVGIIVE
jgi:hypothetical protein